MSRAVLTRLAVMIVLAVTAGSIAVQPAQAIMLVSRSQEIQIGKEVRQQAIREYGLSGDAWAIERVRRVGAQMASVSPRKGIPYSYTVVGSNVINAFAAPGGPVMITDRLVRMLNTDGELAFVLGHETGHIAAEHGRKAINQAILAQGIASLLFGRSSQIVSAGINVMYTLYERGYSRDQEYQADSYGLQFMRSAGYSPDDAIRALAKLGMQRTSGINKYLATHPDIPDRINRIASMAGVSQAQAQQLITEARSEPSAR